MQLSCFHCSQPFTITADQLGGKATCPHCAQEVSLPKAENDPDRDEDRRPFAKRWLDNSLSTLVSIVFHMLLMIIAALITFGGEGGAGMGEDVLIGELPSEILDTSQTEEFDAEEVTEQKAEMEMADELEVAPPVASETSDVSDELIEISPSTGGDAGAFSVGEMSAGGGGSTSGGSWDGLIQNLRRNGLDIVLAFDSTGSMGGEIREVKAQINRIGSALVRLVPKARISICTYRDENDDYVVKGQPLTSDMQKIEDFLRSVTAGGGGDNPEAVHEGLRWSADANQFRPRARKVILLFGDAPPHDRFLSECLRTASDFHGQTKGFVSTVTCRQSRRIPEFIEIAQMGGGEAFLTADERQIMTKLMVLVFGSRHKAKVMEAFKLID